MAAQLQADQRAGDLTVHTGREGVASLMGHDLTLRVGAWTAHAMVDDDGGVSGCRLVAAVRSLEVLHGEGGVKPLTTHDMTTILGHAFHALKATTQSEVVFEAGHLQLRPGPSRLLGRVTIAGVTRPLGVTLQIDRSADRWTVAARCALRQTDFGLTPYSGMLGALRVKDLVEVKADITVLTG